MVERKEVEALLAACEMIREHELDPVNHSPIVPAPELAALCRAWLAVDEGVPGLVDSIGYANGAVRDTTTIKHIHGGTGAGLNVPGRVRIVKEAGE